MRMLRFALCGLVLGASLSAGAAPVHYTIDPKHTYVSIAVPHLGISHWRGKFDRTRGGWVELDPSAGKGALEVTVDTGSLDFGFAPMSRKAIGQDVLDAAKYPTAVYKSDHVIFAHGVPVAVDGTLTLHGVTRPLRIDIKHFKCITDPFLKVERCGADAYARFDRTDYGIDYGAKLEGGGDVELQIQVEALRTKTG